MFSPLTTKETTMSTSTDLAQRAFDQYKTLCFFDIRDDFRVSQDNLGFVISRLRSEGNMKSFRAAGEIAKAREEERDAAGGVSEENSGVDRQESKS